MGQTQTIGKTATTVYTENGFTCVKYHWTNVVKFNAEKIILDSNAFSTVTTKARMNQTSNQFNLGYQVFQKDFAWFVDFKGETLDYYDHIELNR